MAPLKPFYPKSDLFGKAQSSVFRELFKQKLEKISKTKEEKEQAKEAGPGKVFSVQDKVKEMQSRAGFGKTQEVKKNTENIKRLAHLIISASEEEHNIELPKLLTSNPQIKTTLDNIIHDTAG